MISNSCQGDRMCETLLQELQILELRSRTRTLSKSGRDRFQHLRRLKNLKSLILHLQPEHRFGRYCNYGCWCLPTPEHDISTAGKGVPVDDIDKACKVQHFCYAWIIQICFPGFCEKQFSESVYHIVWPFSLPLI